MNLRRGSCGAWVAAAALTTSSAQAQSERQELLQGRRKDFESPQNFAIEVRLSPYLPDVDSDPALGGKTPYQDVFGSSRRLLFGLEFDWQAARIPHLGTIGPGLGAGLLSASANASSGETTSLAIYPFYAAAVLRVDALWRDLRIPFVPYAKLGVGVAFWRASNTLGTSVYQGVSGKGHSLGPHFALGLGLDLNAFDPYAAKNFDNAMGVNSTYLFAELTREDLTGLGLQEAPLRVGGTNWTFGLAFEF